MIDTHCHLEQPVYDHDREDVIKGCKRQLQAVITSSVHPKHFDLTMQLVRRHRTFVFASASLHPKYIRDFNEAEIIKYIEQIKFNKQNIVAIGETGLDYNWIKQANWRKMQKKFFEQSISLAMELQLPLVIHSRDATEDAIEILEQLTVKRAQMHMFTARSSLKRVMDNGWFISVNTLLLRSKTVRKIVRDYPLEHLMLETDAPWLGIGKDGSIKPINEVRNEPTAVRLVAEKIAEIKKLDVEQIDKQTTINAINFFNLDIDAEASGV